MLQPCSFEQKSLYLNKYSMNVWETYVEPWSVKAVFGMVISNGP